MDKCREAFEAKYRELHPNDKCTLMANGNYSGWIKQDHWWAWQSRQAELDQLSHEITRLKYLVGEKIGNPSVRDLLDAEVQRQLEVQKQSRKKEFLTDEDIENIIKGVLKDHDENPNKYWINIYKQVDDLQIATNEKDKRIEEILFVIARAKDGYYGYSKDGGDTDNLVSDLEKALRGNNANS